MDAWLTSTGAVTLLLQVVALGGLVRERRGRRALALPAYLLTATFAQGVRLVWSDLALRWDYWALKELLLRVLMAATVVEIATRVFWQLERARRRAWMLLTLVVAATVLVGWQSVNLPGGAAPGTWHHSLVVDVLPRLAIGTILLCLCTLGAMAHYRVPLDPLHRAVLFGVATFLLVYAGPMGSADEHVAGRFVMYYVTPVVYIAVLCVWSWTAWRMEPALDVPRDVVERVQPWRRLGR